MATTSTDSTPEGSAPTRPILIPDLPDTPIRDPLYPPPQSSLSYQPSLSDSPPATAQRAEAGKGPATKVKHTVVKVSTLHIYVRCFVMAVLVERDLTSHPPPRQEVPQVQCNQICKDKLQLIMHVFFYQNTKNIFIYFPESRS